jgi:hypothetical protein
MDETNDVTPPPPPRPEWAPAAPPPPPPPPSVPAKVSWWSSLDRASRIALGVAVALLVLAIAVGAYGISRVGRPSVSNVAATRPGPNRFGFGGGGFGGRGMMRNFRMQGLSVAAKTIGVSQTDLQNELASGKSIADVAKEHNVDEQKVIDAMVASERTQIDAAVKDGSIPQALASRLEAALPQIVAARVNAPGGRGGFGFGRGSDGGEPGGATPPAPTAASSSVTSQ